MPGPYLFYVFNLESKTAPGFSRMIVGSSGVTTCKSPFYSNSCEFYTAYVYYHNESTKQNTIDIYLILKDVSRAGGVRYEI